MYGVQEALSDVGLHPCPCHLPGSVKQSGSHRRRCGRNCRYRHWCEPNTAVIGLPVGPRLQVPCLESWWAVKEPLHDVVGGMHCVHHEEIVEKSAHVAGSKYSPRRRPLRMLDELDERDAV